MMSRKQSFLGMSLAAVIMALTACGAERATCASSPEPLRIMFVRPQESRIPFGRTLLSRIATARLFTIGRDGTIKPSLVAAWHTTDRRIWTIRLRDGLRFHDGQPMLAEKVREILVERARRDRLHNPVLHDLESIEAPSPTLLVFHLRRPSSAFLEVLATPYTSLNAGPYRMVKESPTQFGFRPDENFIEDVRKVPELRVDAVRSPRAAWAALLRAETDFVYEISPASASLLAHQPDVRLYQDFRGFMYSLVFQLRHPLLRQRLVRQALNLAIDRESIVRNVFDGYTEAARGPFSPDYWAAANVGEAWAYDPVRARALLRQALGERYDFGELICLTISESPLIAEVAAAVELQLRRIGIRIRLIPLPLEELHERIPAGDFDLYVMSHNVGMGTFWPYMQWHSDSARVKEFGPMGYVSADAALDALYTAATPDEEREGARAVIAKMYEDPPAAFIAAAPRIHAVRRVWSVPEYEGETRDSIYRWTRNDLGPCGNLPAR